MRVSRHHPPGPCDLWAVERGDLLPLPGVPGYHLAARAARTASSECRVHSGLPLALALKGLRFTSSIACPALR